MTKANPTVAQYTLNRLSQLGIDCVFGVPGDYAFSIDDAVEVCPNLKWIGCSNELNAAYAADGYARIRKAAILTTTYGVGELSAINGVMGSKAHRLPVFHLVGMPSERIQHQGLITHHNLGDTVYDRFHSISSAACCVSAILTPDNCIEELERVIREALRQSMPAYIVISEVHGVMPVIGTLVSGKEIHKIKRQHSSQVELQAAAETIVKRLTHAKNPLAIVTSITSRYGVANLAMDLIKKANIPFAAMSYDKGCIDESMPQYIGLFAGDFSSPKEVHDMVNTADLILDIGGLMQTELNTGFWSGCIESKKLISIHDNWVKAQDKVFLSTAIDDVLTLLISNVPSLPSRHLPKPATVSTSALKTDKISSATFYPRLQKQLKSGDTLIIETGSCMNYLNKMLLPQGVNAEGQGLWGSIGWATPACLGISLAKTSGRTWLVTGDGAHQLTLNEIGVMGRYGIKPKIFVINNGIFGIEDVISERGHAYDDIASVQYHKLPSAFGCKNWIVEKVSTISQLDEIMQRLSEEDCAAYIEVMISNEESQPLSANIIDRAYKILTPKAD